VANVVSPPRSSPARVTTARRESGGPSRGAVAARGGAHVRSKATAAPAPVPVPAPAPTAADADAEVAAAEAGDAETNGGIEAADFTGAVEIEQPPQDLEDSHDESAEHVGQAYDEHDAQDEPLEAPTAESESDADPVLSQNLTEEDHRDTGEAVSSGQLAPGEEEADHTVSSEPEAEAALEHEPEPDSASCGMEPQARLDEVKSRHSAAGNELEDMVNLLQGDSSFPSSTHLEVAGEIPDEE
jgi:hypothetical protein